MERTVLPPSMMVTAIIGFIISAVYMFPFDQPTSTWDRLFAAWGPNVGLSLGFSFCLVFVLMFIASIVSMTPKG
jgi:hypothetical protein